MAKKGKLGKKTTKETIERAEILLQAHKGVPPIQANPSTKVHLLVKELRKWIQYFSG